MLLNHEQSCGKIGHQYILKLPSGHEYATYKEVHEKFDLIHDDGKRVEVLIQTASLSPQKVSRIYL